MKQVIYMLLSHRTRCSHAQLQRAACVHADRDKKRTLSYVHNNGDTNTTTNDRICRKREWYTKSGECVAAPAGVSLCSLQVSVSQGGMLFRHHALCPHAQLRPCSLHACRQRAYRGCHLPSRVACDLWCPLVVSQCSLQARVQQGADDAMYSCHR